MNVHFSFQYSATILIFLETPHRYRGTSVVSSKVDQRLLALENCGDACLFPIRAICRHVCAVSTSRQSNFRGAGGVALPLRPNESEAFQTSMRLCFSVTTR